MKKILLLEDNLDILQVVEAVLTLEQFEVQATTKSIEFIHLVNDFQPDLIILDFLLEDGNGGAICRTLKQHPELKYIPVIIYSAYVHPELNLMSFGCDAVIQKPFDLNHLVATIQQLTEQAIYTV